MNEGCRGGWSILHGFFAESGGLVEEGCAPYTGEANSCASHAQCNEIARVSRSYMLSDMSESGIQKEIMMNGMVDANVDMPSGHSAFGAGVMRSDYGGGSPSVPNHVLAIIGWGVEEGTNTKYWIVRNAYGSANGENGSMKIERGKNLF
jgi:C1A family cysteine protease